MDACMSASDVDRPSGWPRQTTSAALNWEIIMDACMSVALNRRLAMDACMSYAQLFSRYVNWARIIDRGTFD